MNNLRETTHYHGIEFTRVAHDSADELPRGTVFLDKKVIPQYPSIERAYVLQEALKKTYGDETFIVEEKIDGTNIRMAYHPQKEEILAFTRGGYICPFTTEHVNCNTNLKELFENFPNLIICGELVGNNPYNHMSTIYSKEPKVLVFDVLKGSSKPKIDLLFPLQRNELLEKYTIEKIPVYGEKTIQDYQELEQILIDLNEKNHEGIVLKALHGLNPRLKFITFYACIVAAADYLVKGYQSSAPSPLGRFYLSACYLHEINGISLQKAKHMLGDLILERLKGAVDSKEVSEIYSIEISSAGWEMLSQRMYNHVDLEILDKNDLNQDRFEISFKKIYRSSSDKLKNFLNGETYTD